MKYFKLYPTVKFLKTKSNSCIYDFSTGQMIKLNSELSDILYKCEKNKPIDDDIKTNEFLNTLENMKIGCYKDTISYEEGFENTMSNIKCKMVPSNNFINKVFIELGSDCNFNCIFCNNDNKLYRKTGCKRWPSYESKINLEDWSEILQNLSYLKAKQLCFIGGNPLLKFDYIKEIIKLSVKYGFKYFLIYTNGSLINNEMIKFFKKYDVALNIQIISFNKDTLRTISDKFINLEEIENNLKLLKNENINTIYEILVSRYNENEIEEIKLTLKDKYAVNSFKIEYIYNHPDNIHFSNKYINNVYDRCNTFPQVTSDRFNFLQMWNSCLKGQCTIKENGEILICPMLRSKIFGNIKECSIQEIISTDEYQKYESISKNSIDKCKACSYRFNCDDCRAIEISATNNPYGLEYCNIEE